MSKEIEDIRKEEIIKACEELYKTENFKDITIKHIGEKEGHTRNLTDAEEGEQIGVTSTAGEKYLISLDSTNNQAIVIYNGVLPTNTNKNYRESGINTYTYILEFEGRILQQQETIEEYYKFENYYW